MSVFLKFWVQNNYRALEEGRSGSRRLIRKLGQWSSGKMTTAGGRHGEK